MAAMHVVTDAAGNSQLEQGIRPFDIGRDLRPVARLIAEAFADELDEQGEAALRELRILGHMSGLIRMLTRSTGELQDIFNGFVWMEAGRLVGNVTVQRASSQSGRWQIANVAVAPDYRGRRIGRALMQTALAYVAEMGGSWAVLQVRESNRIARGLYERMGFENMGGMVHMGADRPPHVPLPTNADPESRLTPFSAAESQILYELVASQQSAESQWWRTVRRTDYELSLEQRVGEWLSRILGRQDVHRMAIQDFKNRFESAVVLTARRWRGTHEIELWARPNSVPEHQRKLVTWALARLSSYPVWPVKATFNTSLTLARETLESYGLGEKHTLLTMRKRVR